MSATVSPVRVGVVGCGAVARLFYVPLFRTLPEARVVGVTDLDPIAATTLAGELCCGAISFEELLHAASLVIVATPPKSHFALARQALEQGLDVVLEKPFAVSAGQAEELVTLARKKNRRLFVAHFRRFFRKTQLARQVVTSGVLGAVVSLEAFEGGRFGWETASGYVSTDLFGGVLLDTGSHTLDQALYAAGLDAAPLLVRPLAVTRDKAEPAHEVDARFELDAGGPVITGRLFVSRRQALANLIRIRCERGVVEFGVRPAGVIRVQGPQGGFELSPDGLAETQADAFHRQYRSLLRCPDTTPLRAELFVGQMRVLSALFNHV